MVLAAAKPTRSREPAVEARLDQVLAIVVTHNGHRWLKDCLVALDDQTHPTMDILVVDDCSNVDDDTPPVEKVAGRFISKSRHRVLRTPRPLGYGAAINWALSQTITDARLLLFVHDDVALDATSVESLVERIRANPSNAVVGPKIVAWDDPTRLQEVGLAADRFGFPYKGLEEKESDSGQRDDVREIFHVTSTCMLVRLDVFQRLRGWDAGMGAFAEDLDLCWRARVAGWDIVVEPNARARHAMAMARGARSTPYRSVRYYSRRNRMRALIKNVSAPRLLGLLPWLLLLSSAEVVGLVALGRLSRAGSVARAVGWNFCALPKTLHARARVQRTRRVSDGALKRLTVPSSFRVRSYLSRERGRRHERASSNASVMTASTGAARPLRMRRSWVWFAAVPAVVIVALALRGLLFAPQVAAGELLPFPSGATTLWVAWWGSWRSASPAGPVTPGTAFLGIFPVLALGSAAVAQKLMILALGASAAAGAYRLVAPWVPARGRLTAAIAYVAGPVGFVGLRTGSLGALVFGAAAPFVIGAVLRLLGWGAQTAKGRARCAGRVALGSAVSGAFVPGSLLVFGGVAILASLGSALSPSQTWHGARHQRGAGDPPAAVLSLTGLVWALGALAASLALLLPWSSTWFEPGGPGSALVGDGTWRAYAERFEGQGLITVLSGMTPAGAGPFGLALALLGAAAPFVCRGRHRSVALLWWAVACTIGAVVSATSAGRVRPAFASPVEAGVVASVALAAVAALGATGLLDQLSSSDGWIRRFAAGATLIASGGLALGGLAPSVLSGAWSPEARFEVASPGALQRVAEALAGADEGEASFKVLWAHHTRLKPPDAGPALPDSPYVVTGPAGPSFADILEPRVSGDERLGRAVATIEAGATDGGGELLDASGIRFVVVDRAPGAGRWLEQLDLALVRTDPDFLLLENVARR